MPKQQDHRSRKPNDPAATGKINPHPPRPRDPKDIPVRQNNPGFPIHKKESPPDGLPLITLQSGIHLSDIKACITTYCKRNDLGRISKIFTSGTFELKIVPLIDNSKLGETADPHNIYRDCIRDELRIAASEAREYEKSKEKLVGFLRAITSKELDDQLDKLFAQQTASLAELKSTLPTSTTDAQMEVFDRAHPATNIDCPLQLWNNIRYLLSTKTIGNKR